MADMAVRQPMVICFYGTSLTTGRLSSRWVERLMEQLRAQPEAVGPIIIRSMGRGSQTSVWGKDNAHLIANLRPTHIVSEGFAINDCAMGVSQADHLTNMGLMRATWVADNPGVKITWMTMSSVGGAGATGRSSLAAYYADEMTFATSNGDAKIDNYLGAASPPGPSGGWPKPLPTALTDSGDGLHPIFVGGTSLYLWPNILFELRKQMATFWGLTAPTAAFDTFPDLSLDNTTVQETTGTTTPVGSVIASLINAHPGATRTLGGTDAGLLSLTGVQIVTTGEIDYETNPVLDFTVTQADSEGFKPNRTQSLSITVTDVNEPVEYLLLGGGGAGARGSPGLRGGAGGGAGGLKTGFLALPLNVAVPITVGLGGKKDGSAHGYRGQGSSIGTLVSVFGGGSNEGTPAGPNGSGAGKGGGSGTNLSTFGTVGQGSDGATTNNNSGGGGGGKGGPGGGTNGVNGGAALSSSITGSAVNYAGGGAGSASPPYGENTYGTPGANAGAAGTASQAGQNAVANRGGGGGGGSCNYIVDYQEEQVYNPETDQFEGNGNFIPIYNTDGGDGGSGTAILKFLTSAFTYTITGSPTVITSGGYTTLIFNAGGSITRTS
jgi:hypothetical protein